MRSVLANFGTMGDVRPVMTLAGELASHGHRVLLALPPFARPMAEELGLDCISIGPDLTSLQNQVNLGMSTSTQICESGDQMLALLAPFRPYLLPMLEQLRAACASADVLVCGPALPLGRIVHELTGIPFVSLQLSHFGGSGGPALRSAGESFLNPFRQSLGLHPIRDPLTTGGNSPQLALYAMSPHLRPRPAEWPPHYHLTGFFYEPEREYKGDPRLSEFIKRGEPPVVVTFGSMVHYERTTLREKILDAIHLAGCRAIVQGMADLATETSPDVYWTGFVPHSWLVSQVSCVVLHGGSGTAAAVFRSGVPGIFVPHGACYDQYYWAQLAEEAGCAVPPIPYSELTATALAKAITTSIQSTSIRNSAAALGLRIRMEAGVHGARGLIEQLVRKIGLQQGETSFDRPTKARPRGRQYYERPKRPVVR